MYTDFDNGTKTIFIYYSYSHSASHFALLCCAFSQLKWRIIDLYENVNNISYYWLNMWSTDCHCILCVCKSHAAATQSQFPSWPSQEFVFVWCLPSKNSLILKNEHNLEKWICHGFFCLCAENQDSSIQFLSSFIWGFYKILVWLLVLVSIYECQIMRFSKISAQKAKALNRITPACVRPSLELHPGWSKARLIRDTSETIKLRIAQHFLSHLV